MKATKLLTLALLSALLAALAAAPAQAEDPPRLRLEVRGPTHAQADGMVRMRVGIQNTGDLPTSGPVNIELVTPPGLNLLFDFEGFCTPGSPTSTCTLTDPIAPQQYRLLNIMFTIDAGLSGPLDLAVTASGGGSAATVGKSRTLTIVDSFPAPGLANWDAGMLNRDGSTARQAGGRPYAVTTTIEFRTKPEDVTGLMFEEPLAQVKDVRVDLPPGLIGNPTVVPTCSLEQFAQSNNEGNADCPRNTQVGILNLSGTIGTIHNVTPPRGSAAAFGFRIKTVPILLLAGLRNDGDYGVKVLSRNTPTTIPFPQVEATFWGVPADPSHDTERLGCHDEQQGGAGGNRCPTDLQRKAFLTAPTDCAAGPLRFDLAYNTHEFPATLTTGSILTHLAPPDEATAVGMTGCELVPFDPSFSALPTVATPDSPTGLEVELGLPHSDNPDGLAQSQVKRAKVTLPEGMTISPSSAGGLVACDDGQLGLRQDRPAQCPDGSKIGTVDLVTPLLEKPVSGGVYVRSQASGDPRSGEMYRLAIELRDDERGVDVKLPGAVVADPDTGRLEVTFDSTPQLPFTSLRMRLKAGPRAPLATPSSCGDKQVRAELASWSGRDVTLTDTFTVSCPSADGFGPAFSAGTADATAGEHSPLSVGIDRADRDQFLSGVEVDFPEGLLAKLRGVPLCGASEAANGGCPAGSRIGSATVGAGPGSSPFFLNGDVFLTTGYKGGPYGLAVHVHAQAGPFDLGWVRVRQAIHVDPVTAKLSVVSDPLPRVVGGVPVRLRRIDVDVDRKDFAVNPTSCADKSIGARLTSTGGAVATASSPFRATACRALGLKPKLALALTGKGQRKRGSHPGVNAVLTQKAGQANLKQVRVTLPDAVALDARRAADPKRLCSYEGGLKADCPAATKIGTAVAQTPLLNRPLRGDVHFVQGVRFDKRTGNRIRTLPTLLVKLRGEIAIDLRASTEVEKGALVTTFASIPDAAVSRFTMKIASGKRAILANNRNICGAGRLTASVETDGQNGRRHDTAPTVKTPCPKRPKEKR